MATFMKPYQEQAYAVLRIVAGLLFVVHGSQKLFGYPPSPMEPPAFIVYVAGPIELIGGLLIAIGLLTRWSAFVCSGTMAVAYWMAHGLKHVLPQLNGGELAVLYCFVFLYIATRGPGIWSVEGARAG